MQQRINILGNNMNINNVLGIIFHTKYYRKNIWPLDFRISYHPTKESLHISYAIWSETIINELVN